MGAFAYERSTKDPYELYWPDLRSNTNGRMAAWCHGAPGIGLARAQVLRARPDLATADITTDIESVWQQMREWQLDQVSYPGQALSDSLCHGTIGNILCLRTMVPFVDDDASQLSCLTRHFHDTINRMSRVGIVCGVPEGIETPGLMNGLAGVGLGILAYDRWQDGVVPTVIGGEAPAPKC